MANSTERSDLPPAELNPLLNPLLAKNMGRWAETYFNAVPERREGAVQELLRELEAEEAQHKQSDITQESDRNRLARESFSAQTTIHAAEPEQHLNAGAVVVCSSCGHENIIGQKFCGMCGATLYPERPDDYAPSPHQEDVPAAYSQRGYNEDRGGYYRRDYEDGDQNLDRMFELQPSYSSSYRVFIALAVAIVAVVLAVVAWRSGQVATAIMRIRGEVPAATTKPPAAAQNPAPAENANTQESAPPNNRALPQAGPSQPQASSQTAQERPTEQKHAEETKAAVDEAAAPEKSAAKPQSVSFVDNGAQELATAQQYSNAGNRAEAAQWLWKAVAKRNLQATLQLSDSYLRGDGVAKSCDQARILLDAAALRGSKEAGVRLRHMQAFGCQ